MSDSSKPIAFADDNLKSDEIGRKFSKRVENTVGKGEITRNEQFLLSSPIVFSKDLHYRYIKKKTGLVWERDKGGGGNLTDCKKVSDRISLRE